METDVMSEFTAIIEKHTVHYRTWPHYESSDGKPIMVGFDLELHGTHDHGNTSFSPGCHLCTETFTDLRRIAEWILPKEERASRYEIAPFDQSLHACSTKGSLEVVLPIRIEHRHDFFGPIDDCEQRCLKEMEEKLAQMGVRRCA